MNQRCELTPDLNQSYALKLRSLHESVAKRVMDLALSSRAMWESQVKQAAGFIAEDGDIDYDTIKQLRIPTKPAMHSNVKPATFSDPKPAGLPI